MSKIDSLLTLLSEAPDGHIDVQITKRLRSLIDVSDEIVATELKEILDLCAAGSLASDFAMNILDSALHIVSQKE